MYTKAQTGMQTLATLHPYYSSSLSPACAWSLVSNVTSHARYDNRHSIEADGRADREDNVVSSVGWLPRNLCPQ